MNQFDLYNNRHFEEEHSTTPRIAKIKVYKKYISAVFFKYTLQLIPYANV